MIIKIDKIDLQSNSQNRAYNKREDYSKSICKRALINYHYTSVDGLKVLHRNQSTSFPFYRLSKNLVSVYNCINLCKNFENSVKEIFEQLDNNLMLIDMKFTEVKTFTNIFTKEELDRIIVSKKRYTSSNTTPMCMIIIDYKKIKQK